MKPETETVHIRIEKEAMKQIRVLAEKESRSYQQQINYIMKKSIGEMLLKRNKLNL